MTIQPSTTPAPPIVPEGFALSDAPLSATPVSFTGIGQPLIQAIGAKRLADLNRYDASISDAYNAVGYWDYATVRGFVIDNKTNYRREGLPISAETAVALDNKASVELFKGTSGLQAGVSSPGGLVNYTVKRPPTSSALPLRELRLEAHSHGSLGAAIDLGGRFGQSAQYGYRVNAALESLNSNYPATRGQRRLLAAAGDWRVNADTQVHAELEYSRRSQPSVPGLSVLGNTLPTPNAMLNLNSQPWSQPVVMTGLTGSLALNHVLTENWRMSAQLGAQSLRTQDRLAYPFGCGKEGNYDRYCSDGTFDVYDYRSEGERRRVLAAKAQLKGQIETGAVKHTVTLSVLNSRASDTLRTQAYNYVGEGSIVAPAPLAADPSLTYAPTNRRERSLELSVSDVIAWNDAFTTWAGVRGTSLRRHSVATDGSQATATRAHLFAPWLAASYQIPKRGMVYASYGQGLETEVVPNRSEYANAGQTLPTAKSQQIEVGYKLNTATTQWQAAAFSITRPAFGNASVAGLSCDGFTPGSCFRQRDGSAVHRGLELSASSLPASASKPWRLEGGITSVQAQRTDSALSPTLNGLRPSNVPRWIARVNGELLVSAVPGLALQAHVSHEANRAVLADNRLILPAWTRLDVAARYSAAYGVWSLGVNNALNTRYFKESPTQYGHVYLFTGEGRALRLALDVKF